MSMSRNWDQGPEWEGFADYQRRHTVKAMDQSAYVMSIVPDKVDIKFAVELGLAIMMNKPIVAVAQPGTHVPPGLRKVADAVVIADLDTEEGKDQFARQLRQVTARFEGTS